MRTSTSKIPKPLMNFNLSFHVRLLWFILGFLDLYIRGTCSFHLQRCKDKKNCPAKRIKETLGVLKWGGGLGRHVLRCHYFVLLGSGAVVCFLYCYSSQNNGTKILFSFSRAGLARASPDFPKGLALAKLPTLCKPPILTWAIDLVFGQAKRSQA